jgi:hypothetical protein
MAMKSQWILIFATFILSCISIAFLITSFATTSWVSGNLKPSATSTANNGGTVNYGLFKGTASLTLIGTQDLSIVCDYGENKCAYSCQTDSDLQEEELARLIKGADLTSLTCPIPKSLVIGKNFNATGKVETTGKAALDDSFINAGLYLSVVIFLAITLVFAVISAIFSIINVVFNPVEQIFGILGLYIWNGVAFFLAAIVMTLYGILFGISIYDNVAIRETLRVGNAYVSDGETMLGYSYWFVIISLFLHEINMILLWYRTRLINKEPPPPTIVVEKNDSTLMLY